MSTDMAGREVRQPGKAGERYREARERRIRESRERKQAFWATRVAQASTPLDAFRVMADRACTAMVQRERLAAIAASRAEGKPGDRAASARLEAVRREITSDLMQLSEQLEQVAARHETHRT